MGILIAAICLIVVGAIAVWLTPLRKVLLQCMENLDRYKFTCRIDQVVNESMPVNQDQFFSVQMIGRIPTPEDNHDTDVKIEINDITKSLFDPEKILSADEQFRSSDDVGFHFVTHNGVVPKKNAVLSRWVTVTQIPCHVLRFAYRGRRKLLFKVTVISKQTNKILSTGQQTIEYVYCSEGFREVQDRRMDILRSTLELAAIATSGGGNLAGAVKDTLNQWIDQKSASFAPAAELKQTVESLEEKLPTLTIAQSADSLLAFGEQTEKICVIELTLQALVGVGVVSSAQFERLTQIAEVLAVKHDRFLAIAQKRLLSGGCVIEKPAALLGIADEMDETLFRKTLNEEYRKWNARVTHPDEEIRQQADQILNLIADLRSERTCQCS